MNRSKTKLPPVAVTYLESRQARRAKRVVCLFHRWLDEQGLRLDELKPPDVFRFFKSLPSHGSNHGTTRNYRARLRKYFAWLHDQGLMPFGAEVTYEHQRKPVPQVEEFVATLEPTLKPGTCALYRQTLRRFHHWLSATGVALHDLSRMQMTQWFIHLSERGLQPCTRAGNIIFVRVYLRWLHEQGVIKVHADDLIRSSDLPKEPSYLPRPISPEADQQLQERLRNSSDLLHQGLLLMRGTGLRIGELQSLEYNCLRSDYEGRQFLKVPLGKLDNERLVPLDEATAKLGENLQKRGRTPRRWLLETECGKQTRYPLYRKALREICEGLNIPDRMTTHRLRHTYATSLLNGGMSLTGLMKLLGHRSFRMTLRYAEITHETVVKEYFEALIQIERKYRTKPDATQVNDFDPVQALADVIRWIRKNVAADALGKRAIRLLIRRLNRTKKEMAALRTAQSK